MKPSRRASVRRPLDPSKLVCEQASTPTRLSRGNCWKSFSAGCARLTTSSAKPRKSDSTILKKADR
ncbi:hypothetical protein B5M09_012430 [Aphanomyces astaci]|uniref:Uncharacterized protein n=1 Tax=Aphanomyces astaci TaxID=112090 RepID=A0A3R8DI53_APHAT|nr:hypothetical protein B5M09_012430 [Aphanomyces astaci]